MKDKDSHFGGVYIRSTKGASLVDRTTSKCISGQPCNAFTGKKLRIRTYDFKINEITEQTAQGTMADLGIQEPLSNVSDCSFVILGQGSLPSELTEEPAATKESTKADSLGNSKSTFSAFELINNSANDKFRSNSFMDVTCESNEEIKKKLDVVIKENYHLKETLTQNNLAIKSQLDTFFMWQQEVLKTHETHKQKFLETKALILKLLEENKTLKKQTEESSLKLSNSDAEDVNAQISKSAEEMERLKEKLEEYVKMCGDLTGRNENLDMENQSLKEELQRGKKEILKLSRELEDVGRENALLKHSIGEHKSNSLGSLSPRSLPNSEARTQISNLLKQLEEEKEKVSKLKEELKKVKLSEREVTKSAAEELCECLVKIDDINSSLDMQNQRLNSMSWIALSGENLKEFKIDNGEDLKLMGEISALKSHLVQEECNVREKQKDVQQLRNQFNKLLLDYKEVQQQLRLVRSNESSIEQYKAEISSLSSELKAKGKELLSKKEECEKLKEAVKELEEKCEIISYQAEMYKTDFKEEQEARRKCSADKTALGEKVIHLESIIKGQEGFSEKECPISSFVYVEKGSPMQETGTWTCPNCMLSTSEAVLEHLRACELLEN